ncbi:Fic/DOC family protein [Xenorhabdus khoisanae]|uniref:Fic/DOC family protein n=1 Tax=Xenorhabdus khoisanae TaxID=880157 RepID=UPI000A7930AB|nr:Fic family protein [Xenorhabdus khoisanae]
MSKYITEDAYTDPKTGVLLNRLGLTNQDELDKAEAAYVATRSIELAYRPLTISSECAYTLEHLQAIHKKLFGDVYEWAGQVRTIDISKGNTRFAHHGTIKREAQRLTRQLADEHYLKGLDREEFSRRVGFYMGELNVLHPFREGNGRTLREYVRQLAHDAGFTIRWDQIDPENLIDAAIHAYHGQSSFLARIIYENSYSISVSP